MKAHYAFSPQIYPLEVTNLTQDDTSQKAMRGARIRVWPDRFWLLSRHLLFRAQRGERSKPKRFRLDGPSILGRAQNPLSRKLDAFTKPKLGPDWER
jgi:hypothetical protein